MSIYLTKICQQLFIFRICYVKHKIIIHNYKQARKENKMDWWNGDGDTYVMTDVSGIRRVLSSRVSTVTTVPVSASRRKISTVMCKSEPSLRKVSWGRSSVMKITSATLTCLGLSKDIMRTTTINPFLSVMKWCILNAFFMKFEPI